MPGPGRNSGLLVWPPAVVQHSFTAAPCQVGPPAWKRGICGEYDWGQLADQEIVALCDVDLARTADAVRRFPQAAVVQDFRRVIEPNDREAAA